MMTCDRCGATDGSVARTKLFPNGFSPPAHRKCKCARLCGDCRAVAVQDFADR